MAESGKAREQLDKLVDEYGKEGCSKQTVKQVEFLQKVAESGTKKTFFWSAVLPGAGHFPLRRWQEGFCFLLLELILSGTILVLFVKSLISIFTSDPHHWHAFLWCLGGAVVFRIVSIARVAYLDNRIKSDAAYLMLRMKDKKTEDSK